MYCVTPKKLRLFQQISERVSHVTIDRPVQLLYKILIDHFKLWQQPRRFRFLKNTKRMSDKR